MDSVATFFSILANVAQVVSVLWLIFAGSKTISDFRKGKPVVAQGPNIQRFQKISLRKGLRKTGLPLALFILILSSGLWFFLHIMPFTSNPVYQANDAQGWKDWQLSTGWSALGNGLLVSNNTGGGSNVALAPYQPETANYAVEAEIQIPNTDNGSFGIFARSSYQYQGSIYQAITYQGYNYTVFNQYAELTGPVAQQPIPVPISLDTGWHVYRIEVKYNVITLFLDGKQLQQVTDNTYLSSGKVGIFASAAQVDVRSFKVFTL
jgi:hypothetical protein